MTSSVDAGNKDTDTTRSCDEEMEATFRVFGGQTWRWIEQVRVLRDSVHRQVVGAVSVRSLLVVQQLKPEAAKIANKGSNLI
jgi:hypothetical protein